MNALNSNLNAEGLQAQQLANALQLAEMAYWEFDVATQTFTFNDAWFRLYRTTAEYEGGYQMHAARFAQRFVPPEEAATVGQHIGAAIQTDDPNYMAEIESNVVFADGTPAVVLLRLRVSKDENGQTVKLYGINQDISTRKKVEEMLRLNEARLSEALQVGQMAHWEFDVATQMFTFNDAWFRLFRTTPEEQGGYQMSAMHFAQRFVPPEEAATVGQQIGAAIQTDDPDYKADVESNVVFADGTPAVVLLRLRVIKDESGQTVKLYGINQDITARKQAEERLRLDEARLEEALHVGQMAYWEFDVATQMFTFNDAWFRLYRTTPEAQGGYQISAQDFAMRFVDPSELATVGANIQAAIETSDPNFMMEQETLVRLGDGRSGYVLLRFRILKDAEGRTVKLYGINQDITARKLSEEQLRINQSRLSEALHVGQMAYWEFDVATQMFAFNDAWFRLYRTTPEAQGGYQISAQDFAMRFVDPSELATVGANIQAAIETSDPNFMMEQETRVRLGDGSPGYVLLRFRILKDDEGRTVKLYGINQDIAARKQAEAQIVKQAADLARVAEISTHIATELNPERLLEQAVEQTRSAFDLYHVQIYRLSDSGDALELLQGTGEAGRAMLAKRWRIPVTRRHSLVVQAARTRQGVLVNDVHEDADFMPNPLLPDTRSEMAVPLIVGDRLLGVLDVQSKQVGYFTEADTRIMTTLASQIAVAMQNANTLASVEQQVQERTAEVRERETLLRNFNANMPGIVFLVDSEGKFVISEGRGLAELGLQPGQVVGLSAFDVYKDIPQICDDIRQCMAGHSLHTLVQVGPMHFETWYEPIFESDGSVRGVIGTSTNVTERIEATESLREREELLRNFNANMPGVVFLVDTEGKFLISEGRGLAELGLQPGQVVGLSAFDVYKDIPEIRNDIRSTLAGESLHSLVSVGPMTFETWYQPLLDADGTVRGAIGTSTNVTERITAVEALREREELLRNFNANMPGVVFLVDTEGKFLISEGRGLAELGLQPGQVVGLSAFDVYKDIPEICADIRSTLAGESLHSLVDVGPMTFETWYQPLLDADGTIRGAIGTSTNVTERIQATKAVQEREELLRNFNANMPGVVFLVDNDGKFLISEGRGLAELGMQSGQVVGLSAFDVYKDIPQICDDIRSTLAGESLHSLVDVGPMTFETWYQPLLDAEGAVRGAIGTSTNVTERIQAAKAVQEREELLRNFNANMPGVVFLVDTEGKFLISEGRGLAELGMQPGQVVGLSAFDVYKDIPQICDDIRSTLTGDSLHTLVKVGPMTFETWYQPLLDAEGTVRGAIGTSTNVTERIQATEAVQEREELLRTFNANMPGIVFLIDAQGKFVISEGRGLAELGLQPGQVVGLSAFDVYAGVPEIIEDVRRSLAGKSLHSQVTVGTMTFDTWYEPIFEADGTVRGVIGTSTNVTERVRLERQVAETMERRGYQVQVGTEIAQEIASAPDLDVLFASVVKLIKEQFGYYHTQILRYERGTDRVNLVSGYGEPGAQMLADGHYLPFGIGLIGLAAASGETIMRSSLEHTPDWKAHPLLPDTKGEIALPIKLRDQVLGVLDVQSDIENALGEDDRLLLEGLCGQIAVAIESTRLRQEMQERLGELSFLYQSASSEGWKAVRNTTQRVPGYQYDHLAVHSLDAGAAPETSPAHTPRGVAAAVPLAIRGATIGTLGVYEEPDLPLTEDERLLIEQVAEEVAQALEEARLFEQTQRVLAETQTLYTGSARIVGAQTLDDVLGGLVNSTLLGTLDQVIIELFDRPWDQRMPDVMVNAAVWERVAGTTNEPVGTVYNMADFSIFNLLSVNDPLVVNDLRTDARVDEVTRALTVNELGLLGLTFWPLVAGGEWFGLLAGQSAAEMSLGEDEIRNIGNLVGQAAIVVQGLRLQQGMRERVNELTRLQRMMSREAWMAYQTQAANATGYYFNRVDVLPVLEDAAVASTAGLASKAALQVRGESIGMLGVKTEAGQTLSLEEQDFLQAVSEQVAQALERARLMEQTQKSAVELQAVAEVSTATATILDPQELLQQVVDLTKSRFGLYHAHIYLMDAGGENLALAVGADEIGRQMTNEGWYIPLDATDSLVAWVARERRGRFVSDIRKESGYLHNPLLPDTLSELAVPMVIGGSLLGVFDVQASTINRFTDEEIRTYSTLASQIAVALQNAKLYAEQLATVERLRELDNMKSAFLANMSHELRTPLNSILGFTQVVLEGLDGPLTDLMTSDLSVIEKNGKHLLNLINDVLDMAKIEAGRLSMAFEPISLYDMLDEVIQTNNALARDKNLYIDLQANTEDEWVVAADHVRLRQILINIIGNSIKFTDAGGITIELAHTLGGTEVLEDRVQVRIRDTGIGIPEHKLEDIFEAFSQVDATTTRKAGGTGLGLPISRRLVELHGGRLWAESDGLGFGSTFFIELPVAHAPENVA